MENLKISFLEKSNIPQASRVLSEAMLKNPLHVAVFGGHGEKERQKIEDMFLELFNEVPGITFLASINNEIVGVMRMKSCDGRKVIEEESKNRDIKNLEWRKSFWQNEWARHDPSDQHWHLGPVGVLPPYQGEGIGAKLLSRFCHEVDACSASAYLETDTDENVQFYKRFDFKIIAEKDILGVNNRFMLRSPVL